MANELNSNNISKDISYFKENAKKSRKRKLSFSRIQGMKIGSKKYIASVKKLFNISIDTGVMKDIAKRRKDMYRDIKKGANAFEVMAKAKADTDYINALHEREYAIMSGVYLEKRANAYISNYLRSLSAMTIEPKIKKFLEEHPTIILEGLLPEIDNYYVYLKGKNKSSKGKKYEVNIGMADTYEQDIKDKLLEYYDNELLEGYGIVKNDKQK